MDKQTYIDGLDGKERAFYKCAIKVFSGLGYTEDECHQKGIEEVDGYHRKREMAGKPETWVNLSTGRKFKAVI